MTARGFNLHPHESRGLLAGRVTQLRRVVRPQPATGTTVVDWNTAENSFVPWCWAANVGSYAGGERTGKPFLSPYRAGQLCFGRETWASVYSSGQWGTIFQADKAYTEGERQHQGGPHYNAEDLPPWMKWRPSTQMPGWAARHRFAIVAVRVERVGEISEAAAVAEGCAPSGWVDAEPPDAVDVFEALWDSLHRKAGERFADSPWTFVYEIRGCA